MQRRTILGGCCSVGTGVLGGCIGDLRSAGLAGTRREAERVHFDEREGEYIISLRNSLHEPVDGSVSITGTDGTTKAEQVSLEPSGVTAIRSPFGSGSEPYTVSVSAAGKTRETTLRPSESPHDKFTYALERDGISFQKAYRPAADLVLSGRLDERIDIRVKIDGRSNSAVGPVYDIITVAPDEVVGVRDVFEAGTEYDVTIQTDGMTESVTHRNSKTDGLWIVVERDGIRIDVGER